MKGVPNAIIDDIIAVCFSKHPARVPLLRAVRDDAVQVHNFERSHFVPLIAGNIPLVLFVADNEEVSTGPAGWGAIPWLRENIKFAVVSSTDTPEEVFQACPQFALDHGPLCIVETNAAHRDAWIGAFRTCGASVLVVNSPPDPMHPLNRLRSARH